MGNTLGVSKYLRESIAGQTWREGTHKRADKRQNTDLKWTDVDRQTDRDRQIDELDRRADRLDRKDRRTRH